MIGTSTTPVRGDDHTILGDSPSQNAALLSANRVYQRRPASTRSTSTSSIASESALAAALRAGSHTPEHGFRRSFRDTPSDVATDTPGSLSLPPQRGHSRSPSHAAALVAAARAGQTRSQDVTPTKRSTILTTRPPVASKSRSLHQHSQTSSDITTLTDSSSIPPTIALVSLFERKDSDTSSGKKQLDPIIIKPVTSVPIQSPKPRRPDGIRSVFKMEVDSAGGIQSSPIHQQAPSGGKAAAELLQKTQDSDRGGSFVDHEQHGPKQTTRKYGTSDQSRHSSSGRPEEGSQIHQVGDTIEYRVASSRSQDNPLRAAAQVTKDLGPPPRLPRRMSPIRIKSSSPSKLSPPTTTPIDIQLPPRPRSSYGVLSNSAVSTQSVSATYRQLYPRKTTPLTSDNELANAIVASSLASSRLSSPQRLDPPPIPLSRRHSRHIFHSRTPSPVKQGLRQTLRKQESSDSDDYVEGHPYGKHQKRRLIRKHPNKHHEGDRKRWRDAVTEGERKRYEGVWAANKGLHITPLLSDSMSAREDSDGLQDQVSSVVVKDIWSRSRLPEPELESVWNLVDNENNGRLSKEEFVVGLWLIDQRLKGRKLPVRVQPTVWQSVRGLHGIKIRKQR